jgi:hypothetical protein
MRYDLGKLPLQTLFLPTIAATSALVRLDERMARSDLREGCISRADFADACASLWVDGELVHLEDLVLHDARMGVRAPTHEVTIAQDVLRTRRRILSHPPGWALSREGLRRLCGRTGEGSDPGILGQASAADKMPEALVPSDEPEDDPLEGYFAALDAAVARSEALLATASQSLPAPAPERDPLVYDADWNEDERLEQWRSVASGTEGLPPMLRAVLLLDAWNGLEVLQHAPWLGRLLAAASLREAGITTVHLAAINLGLKSIPRERRASRDRTTRLTALLDGIAAGAEQGMKEHDRLLLARQQMQQRLAGRRQNSKSPQLVDLVLSRPMVSAGMIAEALSITPQGALKIAAELNLRELTGRGRFRAWGVL